MIYKVGANEQYKLPSQVAALPTLADGDEIQIQPGVYDDSCAWPKKVTVRGVSAADGSKPKVVWTKGTSVRIAWGKGIFVIAADGVVIDNIEFAGARAADGNGAAIAPEPDISCVIKNCIIHDCEDGILARIPASTAPSNVIEIYNSEFFNCGTGNGGTHNIYINNIGKLIFKGNYSHHCKAGHLLKCRAVAAEISYNRFTSEGNDSGYEINMPNGGDYLILGNIVVKSAECGQHALIGYGEEGLVTGRNNNLRVYFNTFDCRGTIGYLFVEVSNIPKGIVANNIIAGPVGGMKWDGGQNGTSSDGSIFTNRDGFDYSVKQGVTLPPPGTVDAMPTSSYKHPMQVVARAANQIGAAPVYGTYTSPTGGVPSTGGTTPTPDPGTGTTDPGTGTGGTGTTGTGTTTSPAVLTLNNVINFTMMDDGTFTGKVKK